MRLPSKDFLSGLLFVAIGAGTALISSGYRMGRLNAMGPGYFPFWLGILLVTFGCVVIFGAGVSGATGKVEADQRPQAGNIRGLVLVTGSIVLFGLLLQPLGLVAAIAALVVVAGLASTEFTVIAAAGQAIALSALAVLLFGYGLGLPLPVWPSFITN